jgi:hypothetical protein
MPRTPPASSADTADGIHRSFTPDVVTILMGRP